MNKFTDDFLSRSREIVLEDDTMMCHPGVFITAEDAQRLYRGLKMTKGKLTSEMRTILSLFAAFQDFDASLYASLKDSDDSPFNTSKTQTKDDKEQIKQFLLTEVKNTFKEIPEGAMTPPGFDYSKA